MYSLFKKLRTSIRANKIATNLSLWVLLVLAQASQKIIHLYNGDTSSKLFFSDFNVDWITGIALVGSGVIFHFFMTKINKSNTSDQLESQNLIEGELASAAMNLGGGLLLSASNIFLNQGNYTTATYITLAGFAIYFISWLLLPD